MDYPGVFGLYDGGVFFLDAFDHLIIERGDIWQVLKGHIGQLDKLDEISFNLLFVTQVDDFQIVPGYDDVGQASRLFRYHLIT